MAESTLSPQMFGVASLNGGCRFFRRSSTGSMPILRAKVSTIRSTTKVASGRPAPRYASVGVAFVMTPVYSYQ